MKTVKYPENIYLKEAILKTGRSITHIALCLGISREKLSYNINGIRKNDEVIKGIRKELGLDT